MLHEGERQNIEPDSPLAIIERALVESAHAVSSHEAERATEWLAELMRRDWAVRVLDAWADQGVDPFATTRYGGKWYCESAYQNRRYVAKDPDAARLAAALAVFPTLSAEMRAELGECPKGTKP